MIFINFIHYFNYYFIKDQNLRSVNYQYHLIDHFYSFHFRFHFHYYCHYHYHFDFLYLNFLN
jgi:hypothetical protein